MRTCFRNSTVRRSGFSLIEVMLALALVSIGIVAILGMLPTGVQSSRDAADNTLSATIVHDVFSTLRSSPFTNITNLNAFVLVPPLPTPCNLQNFNSSTSAYFDQAGFSTTQPNGYYKITLNFQPEIPPTAPIGTPATVSMVTATVVWPSHSVAPINNSVFVTKIAQYYQ